MKKFSLAGLCALALWGCTNLDDAKLTSRETFMHFYEGANNFVAASAAITDDGYVLAGTVAITGDSTSTSLIVIKTDVMGQKEWQTVIGGGSASSIAVYNGGYIVIGDSIQYNPDSGTISELENDASRLIYLDMDGNVTKDVSFSRKISGQQVDYHGDAITIDKDGNLITLGTYREPGGYEFSYIAALNASTLDTLWSRNYNYIQRDYVNARAVHYNGGNILWGSSVSSTVGNFSRSYLTVPVIPENSSFVNSDYFGQYTDQTLLIKDMQASAASGYGAIGVYSQSDGTRSNVFFIRVDNRGNFQEENVKYFDGINSEENEAIGDPALSESEDAGEAIGSTRDGGYILACTIETTPRRGNGGKDIWLIRIDAFGNPQWNTILGGPTNETAASIHETADGGFIICGTLQDGNAQTGGLSSMFLIKTNSEGQLTN